MPYIARYNTRCASCGGQIRSGIDMISSRVRADGGKDRFHANCRTGFGQNLGEKIPQNDAAKTAQLDEIERELARREAQERSVPKPIPGLSDEAITRLDRKIDRVDSENQRRISGLNAALVDRTKCIEQNVTTITSQIQQKVSIADAQKLIRDAVAAQLTPKEVTIRTLPSLPPVEIKGKRRHRQYDDLLAILGCGYNVYLHDPPEGGGGPGSGKSTAAMQVADDFGIQYVYIPLGPATPESRIFGYMDVNGKFVETPFYRAYTSGGVICIEEMDNASAALLTQLNVALENSHCSFPNGVQKRHEKCLIVGTGNTCGRGANPTFPERRPFDGAFAERFIYLAWSYDPSLESDIARAEWDHDNAELWTMWVQSVRQFVSRERLRVIASPRASQRGARLLSIGKWTPEKIAEMTIFRGIDNDTQKKIYGACAMPWPRQEVLKCA